MLTRFLPERLSVRLGLAALAGVPGVFCFAPFEWFWLAVPVWAALFALLRQGKSPKEAAGLSFAFGMGFFLAGVSWVYVSLSVFGGMQWWLAGLAAFLFCAVLALCYALAGWLYKRWEPATFWQQAIYFAALIAAVDWLRGWLFTGFPWLALGYSQTPPSPLAGFAPLIGVYGLSLLVALLAAFALRWRWGLTALLLVLSLGAGLQRVVWTTPVGQPVTVALVQGNVPQDMKFQPGNFVRTLSLYLDLVARHPAQLIVLPETAIPAFYGQLPADYIAALKSAAQAGGGDVVFGTLTGEGDNYWNSAVSLGVSPSQIYSKSHLVPFGEMIPPGFSWFLQVSNIPMSAFTRGSEKQVPLAVAGQHVAVNICYEDVFGEEIIRALPQAGILANLSNTAWFGDSLAQPQHLQISRMRALETGRPMLRATNTGMTAIIAPDGKVQSALPPFTLGVLKGEVRAHKGMTPYARFGNWPALMLIMLLIGLSRWRNPSR